ncbi:ImmA/IrrE family metallo-endopeptidase, partial [Muribaculum intestinale]|uniref:ImmA/IrrE family metallo-endopeptidase n=1 Tax=Muribaculum intestinale TaxID=1796646 RepID=UPI0025B783AC
RAEYISAKARTVIVDNSLLEESQKHRYRFTLGHEGGHDIFHSAFFRYDPNQMSFFGSTMAPMIQCRRDNTKMSKTNPRSWNDHDRMEFQANRFSSAILMPKSAVELVAQRHRKERSLIRSIAIVHDVVETFDVSMEAATYRLKELGIVSKDFSVPYAGMDFIEVYADELERVNDASAFGLRNLASMHTVQKILRKCVLRRFYSNRDGHLRSKIVSLTYANGCATITLTPTRRYYL